MDPELTLYDLFKAQRLDMERAAKKAQLMRLLNRGGTGSLAASDLDAVGLTGALNARVISGLLLLGLAVGW